MLTTNAAWRAINADPALLEYVMWAKAYEVPHRVSPNRLCVCLLPDGKTMGIYAS